ncbi:DnaJ C-terminal domain-containing protein [Candidatus Poriferisodalis sp.]|uniref:DnaJ C-terminal domain-containing protein n=1 Tax=Candidatus Poriferisodalis sp. TaxID=3101277 RepID=UPI003D144137
MNVQREWFETDYYAALGISPDASDKEVTKAYRKLARKHHPDAAGGDEAHFKEISAAYDVVGNESKRAAYDEARRLGPGGYGPQMGGFASGPGGFSIRVEDLGDLGGIFGDLFGAGRSAVGGVMAMRGQDLETRMGISFRNAVEGVITEVSVPDTTNGGIRPVKVRIPSGVEDGVRIRLAGKGAPGSGGGPNGDLFVIVDVTLDPEFGRDGHHLTVTVPITYPEAVLGADVKVLAYDGGAVTLRIPAGTPSGKTFRVRGRGVTTRRGTGDLLVTVEIAVPTELSAPERAATEALGDVADFDTSSSRRRRARPIDAHTADARAADNGAAVDAEQSTNHVSGTAAGHARPDESRPDAPGGQP